MSVSTTPPGKWERMAQNGHQPPSRMDMRLRESGGVQSQMVLASNGLVNAMRYMRDNPLDFLVSAGTSMVMFIAVKTALVTVFPALGAGILAAMATSALIATARGVNKATKERRRRIDRLYSQNAAPTAADLALAKSVDVAGIMTETVSSSLLTGFLSGLTGAAVGFLADQEFDLWDGMAVPQYMRINDGIPTGPEYEAYLDKLGDRENSGNFYGDNTRGFSGRLQFGESALIDLGYYEHDGTSGRNQDWRNGWTDKSRSLGVNSIEDFMNNEDFQRKVEKDWMRHLWSEIDRLELDEYVGRQARAPDGSTFTITESGLLAGAHLGGPGGLRDYLQNVNNASDGATRISDYVYEFSGHEVPFKPGNPDQIPFNVAFAISDTKVFNGISFIHPLPTDADYIRNTSGYGPRVPPTAGASANHWGFDIAAFKDTPVLATADGVVTEVDSNKTAGNNLKIYHGKDSLGQPVYTRYVHLDDIYVKEGDRIPQGYQIGEVGSTGVSTASHLHYELNVNGKPIDPLNCLPYVPERGSRANYRGA